MSDERKNWLDRVGVIHLWNTIKAALNDKVDKIDGMGLSSNDFTIEEKKKLEALSDPAVASAENDGLMSAADKVKLDGIEKNATHYIHPSYEEKQAGVYRISVDKTGHVATADKMTADELKAEGISPAEHTHDLNKLAEGLDAITSAADDADVVIVGHDETDNNGVASKKYYKRTLSTIWDWVKSKADGVYQPKGSYAASGHTHDMSTLTGNVINTEPSTDNHKVVLGKAGLDKCEFFEYGGIWNFYKGQSLVASIQPDGIHAALKGTADTADIANFAKTTCIDQYKTVSLTDLDQNTWYPVTGDWIPYKGLRHFKCSVQLNSGSKPSWSTHSAGFTAVVDILEEAGGWGTTHRQGMVLVNDQSWIADANNPPVGYRQMGNGSIPVWWLRGGGVYELATDYDCTWTIQKSTYENSNQSVSPTTSYPGVNVNRATITADLNGGVKDYAGSGTIQIGYANEGLTTSNLTHIAGYTDNGTKIKDVSKDVLKSWLGVSNITSQTSDPGAGSSLATGSILLVYA